MTQSISHVFKCFVVMPFSDTEHVRDGATVKITGQQWSHIYEHWIKKAVESFPRHSFRCVRSPAQPGSFIKGIVNDLYESDIVIADLTGSKPNVYYELGIRHALDTGTIMITQDIGCVPSDLRGYYCFPYCYSSEHHEYAVHFPQFEAQLHEKIAYIFDNASPSDNPVSDFLGHKNAFLEHTFEQEKSELIYLCELAHDLMKRNYAQCAFLQAAARQESPPEDAAVPIFDFFPFDLLLSRVINTRWQAIPMSMIEAFNELVQRIRLTFLPIHQGWHVAQINPTSDANGNFLELVDAALRSRPEQEEELMEGIIKSVKELTYSITFTPKTSSARESGAV